MVLCRRLSQVRHLEDALEAAGLRFTVEGGKSFFDRQEVHEALAVLRAIDDPSDRVSLVAALRSSFFGVSDRDITAYALSGGMLWMGDGDESLPGGIARRARAGPARRAAPPAHADLGAGAHRAALRPHADPGRAHRQPARRGPGLEPGEDRRPGPQGLRAAGPHPARLHAPARGAHPLRARGAGPSVHAPGRPRHRAHPVHPQGEGAGGAGRDPLRLRRRLLQPARLRDPVGPAARSRWASAAAASRRAGTRWWRRSRRARGRRRAGCCTWPARGPATCW